MARSLLTVLLATAATAAAKQVTIDNTRPRLTSTGDILDGHDGRINRFDPGGPYWLHTLSYGLCEEPQGYGCNGYSIPNHTCGFRLDHNITIWTSPDLSSGSWQYVGSAIDVAARPPGIVFRPDVVYNPNTNKYVLWWNQVEPDGTYLGFMAATADTPAGPFTNLSLVTLSHSNATFHAGDFHLFVDDDGSGYVIYGAQFNMWIDKLTPDYLNGTGTNYGTDWTGPIGPYFVEAPAMFKRSGVYYALFDHCCCFCYQGSGIRVFTAPSPLGPWTPQGGGWGTDLACVDPSDATSSTMAEGASSSSYAAAAGLSSGMGGGPITPLPTPGQGCLYNASNQVSVVKSQQSSVALVDTPTGILFLWIGDRWQQAPDGIKGHEPQFWTPLTFNADGSIATVSWVDNFTMDVI